MPAIQLKVGEGMVKRYFAPAIHRMAVVAVILGPIFFGQGIFMEIFMAIGAIGALVRKIPGVILPVAFKTGGRHVGAFKREAGLLVFFEGEGGW